MSRIAAPGRPKETPWSFGHELLGTDLDRISPSNSKSALSHFPALQNAGIKQIINGPFTFAPDGNPLVGPVPGLNQLLDRLRRHGWLQPGRRRRVDTVPTG
jgi:dimethylglycine dehydrogenase